MASVLLIFGVVIALVVVAVSVTTIVLVCNFNKKGKFVKCTNCGSNLEANSKFCENCGQIVK
jgi:rRNA maturation endonuclease Nob1